MRVLPVIAATLTLGMATQNALADSTISLALAGEAYGGAPRFEVRMGNKVIGEGVVDKAIDTETQGRLFGITSLSRYVEEFVFDIPDADFDPTAPITIVLTNDRYADIGDGYDRNIFIRAVGVNGVEMPGKDIEIIEYGTILVDVPLHMDLRPLYGGGQKAIARPPETGWPVLGDVGAIDDTLTFPPRRPEGL